MIYYLYFIHIKITVKFGTLYKMADFNGGKVTIFSQEAPNWCAGLHKNYSFD